MKRATLLYNPAAGRGRIGPAALGSVVTALQGCGIHAESVATRGAGTAAEQASNAAKISDIVFACGGDGTVHEVLQGLVFQADTTLGVLPFGSANVLARHLKLSLDPVRAAIQQAHRASVPVTLGHLTYAGPMGEQSRFFASVAGAGADGMLAYRMLGKSKLRLGRYAYYLRAIRLLGNNFSPFQIDYTLQDGTTETTLAISAMTTRVNNLGGLFRPLAQRSSVLHDYLSLTTVRPPSIWSLPAWFAASWTGLAQYNRWQEHLSIESVHCGEGLQAPVQVQADGEWLGRTPMKISLVPNAIRLFCPAAPTSRSEP